ncbi:MAG: P-type conjugative transfer protein VirB9 [Rickettsiaceae bacterium]|nr:P-type conjugative transfer protein VirB9 [Rickettsiaceae bacterium]
MLIQIKKIFTAILLLIFSNYAFAVREPRPISTDSRIRVITYSPNEVFKFTGYYNYQASIELAQDEEIVSISMGNQTAWQMVPSGYRIFLKPIEDDADTNMTLITNKRVYFFELYGLMAIDMRDPDMVFNVKFLYPDEESNSSDIVMLETHGSSDLPDLAHPEKYNFNYSVSGSDMISPTKIYDDGEFTYLEFKDINAEMPAIFAVDENLYENIVNYRINNQKAPTVIIERVYPKLSLKSGKNVACIFNDQMLEVLNKSNKSNKRK